MSSTSYGSGLLEGERLFYLWKKLAGDPSSIGEANTSLKDSVIDVPRPTRRDNISFYLPFVVQFSKFLKLDEAIISKRDAFNWFDILPYNMFCD